MGYVIRTKKHGWSVYHLVDSRNQYKILENLHTYIEMQPSDLRCIFFKSNRNNIPVDDKCCDFVLRSLTTTSATLVLRQSSISKQNVATLDRYGNVPGVIKSGNLRHQVNSDSDLVCFIF